MIEIIRFDTPGEQFIAVRGYYKQEKHGIGGTNRPNQVLYFPFNTKLRVDIEGERKQIVPVEEVSTTVRDVGV